MEEATIFSRASTGHADHLPSCFPPPSNVNRPSPVLVSRSNVVPPFALTCAHDRRQSFLRPPQNAARGAPRARPARRRGGAPRPRLPSRGRPDGLRRRVRRAEAAAPRARGDFPEARDAGRPGVDRRRQTVGQIQVGPPRRPDAVARQRLRRCGRRRVRRARAPLPRSRRGCPAGHHGRAEDRRPVLLAPLRGRTAGRRRHAGRWLRGGGRHRQRPHRRRHPGQARG